MLLYVYDTSTEPKVNACFRRRFSREDKNNFAPNAKCQRERGLVRTRRQEDFWNSLSCDTTVRIQTVSARETTDLWPRIDVTASPESNKPGYLKRMSIGSFFLILLPVTVGSLQVRLSSIRIPILTWHVSFPNTLTVAPAQKAWPMRAREQSIIDGLTLRWLVPWMALKKAQRQRACINDGCF